ncbi:hypothetical protein EDD15DRAFT_1894550 [Pisolithus albus]|nr:hypothetical protein EDD15DRAFT_1894550 [Pisolithus albus]
MDPFGHPSVRRLLWAGRLQPLFPLKPFFVCTAWLVEYVERNSIIFVFRDTTSKWTCICGMCGCELIQRKNRRYVSKVVCGSHNNIETYLCTTYTMEQDPRTPVCVAFCASSAERAELAGCPPRSQRVRLIQFGHPYLIDSEDLYRKKYTVVVSGLNEREDVDQCTTNHFAPCPICGTFSSEQSRGHKSSGLAKLLRLLVRVPVLKKDVGCSVVLVLRSDKNISSD